MNGLRPVLTQLGLDPPLRCLVAQLQTQLLVKTIDSLGVHGPSLPAQQHMDTPISVTDTRRRDLLDPLLQGSLIAALRLVVIERGVDPKTGTGAPDRHLPVLADLIDKTAAASRLQS
jgi:hypothetical protein